MSEWTVLLLIVAGCAVLALLIPALIFGYVLGGVFSKAARAASQWKRE